MWNPKPRLDARNGALKPEPADSHTEDLPQQQLVHVRTKQQRKTVESGAVTRRVRPRSLEIEEGELPGSDDEDGLVYDNDDKDYSGITTSEDQFLNDIQARVKRNHSNNEYTVKVQQLVPKVTKKILRHCFEKIGSVKSVRMIKTSFPHNFAYVNYVKQKDAYSAVEKLNSSVLCGHPIHVHIHQGNTHVNHPVPKQYTVKVKHLSGRVTENELLEVFSAHGIVKDLRINTVPDSHNYAYVNYANLNDALTASEKLNGKKLYGAAITVFLHNRCTDKYPRQSHLGSSKTEQHIVKVENIPGWITKEDLECSFCLYGPVSLVDLQETPQPFNHAYIHFYKQNDASRALEEINREGIHIGQHSVHIYVKAVSNKRRKLSCSVTIDHNAAQQSLHEQQLDTHGSLMEDITASQVVPPDIPGVHKTLNHVKDCTEMKKSIESISADAEKSALAELDLSLAIAITDVTLQIVAYNTTQIKTLLCIIQCPPLVMKVLHSYYPNDIAKYQRVPSVEPKEFDSTLVLPVNTKQLELLEQEIKQLLKKVDSSIANKTFMLPCHYLPLSSNNCFEDAVKTIESKHAISVKVLDDGNKELGTVECVQMFRSIIKSKKDAIETKLMSSLLHKHELPVQCIGAQCHTWSWENDTHGYTEYSLDVANELTKKFLLSTKEPFPLNIGSNMYNINFASMKQVNAKTNYERTIKHLVNHSNLCNLNPERFKHSPSHMLCMKIEGHKDCLDQAISDLKSEMEKSMHMSESSVPVDLKNSVILEVTDLYCIEAQIVQGNLVLRGAEEYIDKVTIQVQKACIKHMSSTCISQTLSRPSHWVPQSEKVLLYDVYAGSPEWNAVINLLHHTLPTANVVKLERIQNVWLWEKYSFTKERMVKKNGQQSLNERRLFHGTNHVVPETIYKSEQGFDFRCSSESNMWGSGTYFAVNAKYSDSYSHKLHVSCSNTMKQMLLADVLTGDAYKCPPDSKLKKPPQKQINGDLYDSVTGNTNGSDIFVIYELDKAYPAYLITYSCT